MLGTVGAETAGTPDITAARYGERFQQVPMVDDAVAQKQQVLEQLQKKGYHLIVLQELYEKVLNLLRKNLKLLLL